VEGPHTDRAQRLYFLDRLGKTTGDTQTPDRKSPFEARGRQATPLLFCSGANESLQSARDRRQREGSVEGPHTHRAQGLCWLDRVSQTTRDAQSNCRKSLCDARIGKTTPLMFSISEATMELDGHSSCQFLHRQDSGGHAHLQRERGASLVGEHGCGSDAVPVAEVGMLDSRAR
jgi:hypothetical protein